MGCQDVVESGGYVLGALTADDRTRYERHLWGCADCRAEVAQLAGLPGLLRRLDPDAVASLVTAIGTARPRRRPLEPVLDEVRRRRWQATRRRWVAWAAFAACLLAVTGLGVSLF